MISDPKVSAKSSLLLAVGFAGFASKFQKLKMLDKDLEKEFLSLKTEFVVAMSKIVDLLSKYSKHKWNAYLMLDSN